VGAKLKTLFNNSSGSLAT